MIVSIKRKKKKRKINPGGIRMMVKKHLADLPVKGSMDVMMMIL